MKKSISKIAICYVLTATLAMLAVTQPTGIPIHPLPFPDTLPIKSGIQTLSPLSYSNLMFKNLGNGKSSPSQPGLTTPIYTDPPITEDRRQADFVYAEDGMAYPLELYKPLLIPSDQYSTQWWQTKISLPTAWEYSPGAKQTVLAIIDTGFALKHEEFANRWYENSGEKGTVSIEQQSRLNCTDRGLPLSKACNVIDDNFDGIVDNETGPTTLQNRSLRNCTDQGLVLDKACNMVDDDNNGFIDDKSGWDFVNYDRSVQAGETNPSGNGTTHGTLVAGIAAATGNNAKGTAGVDWFTKILPLQALDDDAYGDTLTVSRSIRYAADQNADVISISLGSTNPDAYLRQAIAYAISKGSIVVAAAGNDGCDCMSYPARYEEVVAVGASNDQDVPTSFSSWGESLDVLAPGINMVSSNWTSANQTGAYASGIAGTSFSAPLVAGLLTKARSHQPQASSSQLIAALTEQTNRLTLPSTMSRTSSLGYGRADAVAVLNRVLIPNSPLMRYGFSPVSAGTLLGNYEPLKPFLAYSCEPDRLGTTPLYRLSKGETIFYTVSEIERYQGIAQGYSSSNFGNVCLSLPTDKPQVTRNLSIPIEFENLGWSKAYLSGF
jgi:subtilisin family serine protease